MQLSLAPRPSPPATSLYVEGVKPQLTPGLVPGPYTIHGISRCLQPRSLPSAPSRLSRKTSLSRVGPRWQAKCTIRAHPGTTCMLFRTLSVFQSSEETTCCWTLLPSLSAAKTTLVAIGSARVASPPAAAPLCASQDTIKGASTALAFLIDLECLGNSHR